MAYVMSQRKFAQENKILTSSGTNPISLLAFLHSCDSCHSWFLRPFKAGRGESCKTKPISRRARCLGHSTIPPFQYSRPEPFVRDKPNLPDAETDANCRSTRGLGGEYADTAAEKTKPILLREQVARPHRASGPAHPRLPRCAPKKIGLAEDDTNGPKH